jgi:hypothetical protein
VQAVKVLAHQAGFTALDMPNHVPLDRRCASTGLLLSNAFFDVILTQQLRPCRDGLLHRFEGMPFGDNHQPHTVWVTPCRAGCLGDTLSYPVQVILYHHNPSSARTFECQNVHWF